MCVCGEIIYLENSTRCKKINGQTEIQQRIQKRNTIFESVPCVSVYIYIYIVFFGPVKPELGVIPSGQEIIYE